MPDTYKENKEMFQQNWNIPIITTELFTGYYPFRFKTVSYSKQIKVHLENIQNPSSFVKINNIIKVYKNHYYYE